MKKFLMTMAAVSALSVGVPAAAQYAGADVQTRVQELQVELQTGGRRGQRYDSADRYDGGGRTYGANDDRYGRDARDGRDEAEVGYLRVGQRISGNFGDMPAQYRDRYRDSDESYYRYDRGNVYQVDARTNLILRIFADGR
jgi:hypothetical protein